MGVKVTVNLPDDIVNTLRQVAEQRKVTLTDAIKQAIVNEKFLRDELRQGSKVMIKRPSEEKPQELRFIE